MAKSDMLRMIVNPLNVAVAAVEELEAKVEALEKDHGMEPSFSVRITGNVPKYSKTIQNLVDLNAKQRDNIKQLQNEIEDMNEYTKGLLDKIRVLEAANHVRTRPAETKQEN